jgi:hypothetical protein
MKVNPNDVPGLRDLGLGSEGSIRFVSELPSMDAVRAAWGSPDLQKLGGTDALGEALTANAAQAVRWAQGIGGVRVGLPGSLLGSLDLAVGSIGGADWRKLASGAAESAIDIGLEGLGSVPVVGWAAKLAASLVVMLVSMRKQKKPRPPLLRYSRDNDEDLATRALRLMYTGRAREVFLPPAVADAWRVEPKDPDGFGVDWSGESTNGLGVLPGGAAVVGSLVSPVHWTSEVYMACKGARCEGINGELGSFERRAILRDWSRVFEGTIESAGALFPSLHRVGGSIWSALSSTKSAYAYELDTSGILDLWAQWFEASGRAARDAMSGGVKMYADRFVGFQALQRSSQLSFYGAGSGSMLDEAERQMAALETLQDELSTSLACAYCSLQQPAIANNLALRTRINESRAKLLTHMARWRVSLQDVPDEAYRAQLRDVTKPQDRPLGANVTENAGGFDEPKRTTPPLGGTGGSAGAGAAAIAAAGAAAFLLF